MTGGKVSDEVIDAIAFIEMHRQETEKESGTAASCAQALPKLQELLEQVTATTTDPADVHAANLNAVNNDIARVKRISSGGGQGGGNKHPRAGGGQKKPPRQHGQGGRPQGQGHAPGGGQTQNHGHGQNPGQGQGRRRGRNKRRGGGGGGGPAAGGGNAGGAGAA